LNTPPIYPQYDRTLLVVGVPDDKIIVHQVRVQLYIGEFKIYIARADEKVRSRKEKVRAAAAGVDGNSSHEGHRKPRRRFLYLPRQKHTSQAADILEAATSAPARAGSRPASILTERCNRLVTYASLTDARRKVLLEVRGLVGQEPTLPWVKLQRSSVYYSDYIFISKRV
jgi:hypothetical protein